MASSMTQPTGVWAPRLTDEHESLGPIFWRAFRLSVRQKISFMADVDDEDFSASRETVEGEESDEEIEVTAAEVLERLEEVKLESF